MTYGGQYPGTGGLPGGGGRHRSLGSAPAPQQFDTTASQPYDAAASQQQYEPELPESEGDERPPRHPWVLASIVGVTVFLATIIIGGTLLAVNDSKTRKAENYADGPPTSTVTVTESVTTTSTTTVTSKPSRSARPSEDPDDGDSNASAASAGWYAQFGSFTSLESAQELAAQMGAQVYRGEEFGQPGQFIVAQREYSRTGARDACDIAEQSCIVKQVE